MKATHTAAVAALTMLSSIVASATDFTTWVTQERGYIEVTTPNEIVSGGEYYYLLVPAEDPSLIVGIGAFEAKPRWASDDSKALRYKSATTDPLLDATNYFTIEKSGQFIGFRNVVYSADLFQTHDEAGFMYVNTYTDKNLDEWSYLTPTRQDGFWIFESGKYPISGGNYYSGYLGPWNNVVKAGEAIALNRKNTAGDEAGHYRLFRISKSDYESSRTQILSQQLLEASADNPVDATWLITNPSFETGDVTGWVRYPDIQNDNEFTTRDYGMSGKEGGYLFNAYQWWAATLSVGQTVKNVPSGEYELTATVATWSGRNVTVKANSSSVTKAGIDDGTGITVNMPVTVGIEESIDIKALTTGKWWDEGHENEKESFFKLDNVRLTCKGIFLNGIAAPLPNDYTTRLTPGQWYYYDIDYSTEYLLMGKLSGMVYSTDGNKMMQSITTQPASKHLTLPTGRVYFKTTESDATLCITADRKLEQTDFTAVALNVDGLPNKVLGITLNADGPGSEGSKLISQYINKKQYDVLGLSEDFNYHKYIISQLGEDYGSGTLRSTISLLEIRFPFDTDGLNVLWKKSKMNMDNESWTKWTTTTSTDGNQYVEKGFRHYEMSLGEGNIVDFYVLHMDAGEANSSREAQWRQLANAINSSDASRPKLIIGDTNSRWTREDIRSNFTDLLTDYDMRDSWVELCLGNNYPDPSMGDLTDDSTPSNYSNYEVVDKIIYLNPKGSDLPQLKANSFKIENDYTYGEMTGTDSGKLLGDHKPVVVEFTYSRSSDSDHLIGDVNRDGKISLVDVMATVEIILGGDNTKPYMYDHFAADIDDEGDISLADLMSIVDIILNQ